MERAYSMKVTELAVRLNNSFFSGEPRFIKSGKIILVLKKSWKLHDVVQESIRI